MKNLVEFVKACAPIVVGVAGGMFVYEQVKKAAAAKTEA